MLEQLGRLIAAGMPADVLDPAPLGPVVVDIVPEHVAHSPTGGCVPLWRGGRTLPLSAFAPLTPPARRCAPSACPDRGCRGNTGTSAARPRGPSRPC